MKISVRLAHQSDCSSGILFDMTVSGGPGLIFVKRLYPKMGHASWQTRHVTGTPELPQALQQRGTAGPRMR